MKHIGKYSSPMSKESSKGYGRLYTQWIVACGLAPEMFINYQYLCGLFSAICVWSATVQRQESESSNWQCQIFFIVNIYIYAFSFKGSSNLSNASEVQHDCLLLMVLVVQDLRSKNTDCLLSPIGVYDLMPPNNQSLVSQILGAELSSKIMFHHILYLFFLFICIM